MRPADIKRRLQLLGKPSVLTPTPSRPTGIAGSPITGSGILQSARASCETKPDLWQSQQCLAVTYDKLGRHADAEAELAKMKAAGDADVWAYQYATIYAQWGNRAKALEWLDTALRLRDPGLELLKTDPLLDPLRKEPRFQAIDAGAEASELSGGAIPTQFLRSLEDRSNVRYVEN
jgi:tetratricopeptide (TPR) repeat protein